MITDIEIFQDYANAKYDLIKTIEERINFKNLSNEQAQKLTELLDNYIIELRKYWM